MRNIVFDLGNVLLRFKPAEDVPRLFGEANAGMLLNAIFRTPEWIELDRGTLTDAQATEIFCQRHPQHARAIVDCMARRQEMLPPIESSVALLPRIKAHGYAMYYLSNYHASLFEIALAQNPFLALFDGGVVSSHVKLIKPDVAIYRALLERYELEAGETLFIDDLEANIAGAREAGLQTLHLPDCGTLEAELLRLAILE